MHYPVNALKKTLAGASAAWDDTPVPSVDLFQLQELFDFVRSETARDILLIAEDQEGGSHKFLLFEEAVQLLLGILQPQFVGAIDNPHNPIGLLEVVAPVAPNSFLSTDIPDIQLEVIVLERFDVEAQRGRDLIDILTIKLLDDGGLACIIKSKHQQPHLLLLLFGLLDDRHEPHFADGFELYFCESYYCKYPTI